jgi:RND superfamily putative drug exporter
MVPVLNATLPSINNVTKNDNTDFLPKNSPSITALHLENNFQPGDTAGTAVIVAVRQGTPLTTADQAAIKQIMSNVSRTDGVNNVKNQGVSADGQADQIQVGINGKGFGNQAADVLAGIRAQTDKKLPAGLQVYVTGDFAQAVDSQNANQSGRNSTELYTVIFILVLLLIVFRSLLAPFITLLPAGLALAVAQPVIAETTKIGVQVSFVTQILLIVLVLGAGTDYGLFLVFRVREELRKGREPKEAVIHALAKVGESITFSAATVIAALLSLMLATFGIYKGLGPALAIALTIMLLVALTFLPALLAILGRAVFWPSKTRQRAQKIGLWGRIADRVIQKPVRMLLLGVLILGGLSLGIIGYKTTGFTSGDAPTNSGSALGQQVIQRHFPAANINPQLLLLQFDQPVWNNLAAVQQAQSELAGSGLFKAVSGPFSANGFSITPAQLQALHSSGAGGPALQAVSQFISPDGKVVQLYAISNAGAPGGTAATNQTPQVRAKLAQVAQQVGAADASVFSNEAAGYDINHVANNDLKRIIPIVLLIIGLLLAIMLRSLVAPIYLVATVALSYLATLGFAMIVFVHLGHHDGLDFVLPFMLFVFSMALGEDYNILVMSRIREEAHKEKTLLAAVTKAIGVTGTTVTSAGLILAGTFGVLGLVGGNIQVEEIGYSIAFGILLDTFFVRTLLVPSIVTLLGRYNWWPSKLYHESKS